MRKLLLASVSFASMASSAQALEIEIFEPTVVANINISTQRMHVSVNGQPTYSWRVSTGAAGYRTPTGNYWPYRMHRQWYSTQYNGASMPYAIFFRGGYAVHGTGAIRRLGRPASHGCVRLHPANAGRLFRLVEKHGRGRTRIVLTGQWKSRAKKRYRKRRWAGRRNRRVGYSNYRRRR